MSSDLLHDALVAVAINSNVLLTINMASNEWETYPANVDCFVPLSEDRLGYRARLAEISTLLFDSGQDQFEAMSVQEGSGGNIRVLSLEPVQRVSQVSDCES